MPDADDLAIIMDALKHYQAHSYIKASSSSGRGFDADLRRADAAILALERIRARLAASVPVEQQTLGLED